MALFRFVTPPSVAIRSRGNPVVPSQSGDLGQGNSARLKGTSEEGVRFKEPDVCAPTAAEDTRSLTDHIPGSLRDHIH